MQQASVDGVWKRRLEILLALQTGHLPATSPPFTSRLATWLSIDIPLVESLRISLIEIHGLMEVLFSTPDVTSVVRLAECALLYSVDGRGQQTCSLLQA